MLAMAQHVLSGGVTTYNRIVGAVLITLLLFLLQRVVYALTGLYRRSHALTYFPSLLLLAILTSVSPRIDSSHEFTIWYVVGPLLLLIYIAVVWMMRSYQPYESLMNSTGLFNRMMWVNMLTLFIMFFFVGLVSTSNDVFHYRMKMEGLMRRGEYAEAIEVGCHSCAVDSSLVMLRAYALAREGLLGERLFEYPLVGRSSSLLPNGCEVKSMMYPSVEIRRFASGRASDDYRLCGYLLDKKIVPFVRSVVKCYRLDSLSLPKHYAEALALYVHQTRHQVEGFRDSSLLSNYAAFRQLSVQSRSDRSRHTELRDRFGNTYWYYFFYQ